MACKVILSLAILVSPLLSFAQKLQTAGGSYVYYAPENVSLEAAKQTALERAKIQIIADKFGTIVSQSSTTRTNIRNGKTQTDFQLLGGSEVKGEWIETLGEPRYEITYAQGMLVVKVHVEGRVREIASAGVDFKARVLRNGIEEKFESDEFRDGDDLFLAFQAPVEGYLTVYLYDGDQVYCLLPYRAEGNGSVKIDANQRYLFFSCKHPTKGVAPDCIDEYTLTCSRTMELNKLYVIFSPHPFTKAVDSEGGSETTPRMLDFDSFQTWLVKCRKRDVEMRMEIKNLTITKS